MSKRLYLHFSFSRRGGAGNAASGLASAQRHSGLDAEHIYATNKELKTEILSNPLQVTSAAIDNYLLGRFDFKNQISITRALFSTNKIPDLSGSIVHLHWPVGLFSPDQIKALEIAKGVVVHLHDEWAFTSVCHFSGGCEGFKTDCSSCPAVRKFAQVYADKSWELKNEAWKSLNPVFVSPSGYLAKKAKDSTLTKNYRIEVIPNLPTKDFVSAAKDAVKTEDDGNLPILAIANNLDDPRKKIKSTVELFGNLRNLGMKRELLLVGSGGRAFRKLPGVNVLGTLSQVKLVEVMASSAALILLSHEESAPLVITEAAHLGVPSIFPRNSPQHDLAVELGIGYPVQNDDLLGLLDTLNGIIATGNVTRERNLENVLSSY